MNGQTFKFLPHCTEKTNEPGSPALWQQAFSAMGLKLQIIASGCCGMSGTYGHETRNVKTSEVIYGQSWQPLIERHDTDGTFVADGYSCRSQVKRLDGKVLMHPLQVWLDQLRMIQGG